MRFSIFAVLLVIAVYCVAPSHQYGTMFADHITPAFNEETHFQGIKTSESFSTDAHIGQIDAHNVAGFSINTPGPVTSHSNMLSMVASQGIEFGATNLSVHSAGSLSLTGQRVDFDADTIDFSGAGDVIMGGIKSQVRAPTFFLETHTDMHLSSTGSTLDINAPVGVFVTAEGEAHFNANNNIELLSRSGEASFTGASLTSVANFIDIDGEVSFSAEATNSLNLSAAAIAEFSSVGSGTNTFDNMNVDVSSGDIVLDAAGILSLKTDDVESSSMLFSAIRNTFVVSRSAAESVIRIDSTEDFSASAVNTLTFGTFNQESDLSFSGQASTSIGASTASVTTTYGDLQARNDLSITSLNDMNFSVTAQDISATSATGNIEFLATAGSFLLSTDDDFVTSSGDAFIDTQSDINVTGHDVSFRQNNIDATGALRVTTASDFDITTGFIELDTSGTLDFTMGGDMLLNADRFTIAGNKASSTVDFNIDGTVTVESRDLDVLYRSDMFLMETNRYIGEALHRIEIEADSSYSFLVGDTTTFQSQQLQLTSDHGAISFSAGDSFTANIDFGNHFSQHFDFDAGNELTISAGNSVTFDADGNFGAELEGRLSVFTPTTLHIMADRTAQFLQRTFDMTSDDVTFNAGESIYHAQNLPSDEFQFFNIPNIAVTGSSVGFVSGGNFFLDAPSSLQLSGDTGFDVRALNALTMSSNSFSVIANGFIGVHSGGELFFDIEDSFEAEIENDFIINGPNGEHGLVSFDAQENVDFDAFGAEAFVSGSSVTLNTVAHLSVVNNDMSMGNGLGDLSIYSGTRTHFFSANSFDVFAGGPISLFGRDEIRLTTQSVTNMVANTALEIRTDVLSFTSMNNLDLFSTFNDARLTFEGDDLDITTDLNFVMVSNDETSFYSGNTLDYSSVGNIDITSAPITFVAPKSFSSTSQTLDLVSVGDSSFLSGGDMLFHFSGDFLNNVSGDVEFEASTFKTTTSLNNNWIVGNGVEMNASDGVVSHFAENFGSYSAGTTATYSAAGSIYHDTGALSFTGLGITARTTQSDGDMIFDSTSNRVSISADQGVLQFDTQSYSNFFAFDDITFDSASSINIINGGDYDFFSKQSTKGTIGTDMTFTSGASGHFEAGNRVEFDATLSFQIESGCNFLVSTGEQGSLSIDSSADFSSVAAESQYWVSSGDFDTNVDLDVSFTTLVGDISLFTTGGSIEIESDDDYALTVGGNVSFTGGDMISISTSAEQNWTSNTDSVSSTAAQGNIILDFDNEDASFLATSNILIQSKGSRDPTDGVTITADIDLNFLATTDPLGVVNVFPQNYMTIGGVLRPDISYLAGGSPTLAGITVGVAGDIITHADEVLWSAANVGGVFTTDVGGSTHITSSGAFNFIGTGELSVTAASDIYLSGDETLNDSGTGFYSATATGGLFKFHSIDGRLVFDAQQNLRIQAKEFIADVGNFEATINSQTDHTLTGGVTYSTTVGNSGSLNFNVNTGTFTSGGASSMTTSGLDAPISFFSNDMDIETQTSGDITFKSAGDLIASTGSMTYNSVNSFSIDANSNRGADLTDGTIDLASKLSMTANIGDSLDATAHRDFEIYASNSINFSARDISFNSADDTLIRTDAISAFVTDIIFQNSVGGGGNVNFLTNSLKDEIEFLVTNGITWNVGQNVVGYAADETSFIADSQNNKQESLTISTTAERGDMYFVSQFGDVNMVATDAFTIDTNAGGPGVFDIHGTQTVDFIGNGLNFVSQSGDIEISSLFGDITITGLDGARFLATGTEGRINIEAHGISSSSQDAIVSRTNGNFVIGAPLATVNVDAWESIELYTDNFSDITIGHVPDVVAGDFVVTGTGTTKLLSSGPDSDIVFNVLDSQHGLGSVTLLAGNKGPADSQIDFVTTENLRFIQESGLTFAGFNEISDTDRPADVFFVSAGVGAAIEVSTDSRAIYSNIQIESDAVIFDADNQLYVKSGPSRSSSTSIVSDLDRVTLTVDSTNSVDSIIVSGYEGNINLVGRNFVSMIAEGSTLTLNGRHGMRIVGEEHVRAQVDTVRISGGDGDVTLSAGDDFYLFADNQLRAQASGDVYFDHSDFTIDAGNDVTFSTRTGNVFYNFGSLLNFRRSNAVEFDTRNALTLPMREEAIVPGEVCSIAGEFFIAHNNFYYSYRMISYNDIENFKDTGVMICYCGPGGSIPLQYYCRPLAETFG